MPFGEILLLFLSRNPKDNDYSTGHKETNVENALISMPFYFPEFMSIIVGKAILDFGCGTGNHTVALAKNGAKLVVGVENNLKILSVAKKLAEEYKMVKNKIVFREKLLKSDNGKFDIAISINSMEHFHDPVKVISDLKSVLKKNGLIFIKFEPTWFSPYGSHTLFFTKVPWVNIIFSEKTVIKVRSRFRDDGATRYEEIEGGLNKMTITKFERIISTCGMEIKYKKYRCIKGINILGKIPCLRELFISQVVCILKKK